VDGGDRVFTVSDPKTSRSDGEGVVTESLDQPAASEWRAGIRFPSTNDRGVMYGLWHRRGDQLHITSHDEFFTPGGTNHVFADLQLHRRLATGPAAANRL